jgi:hypothetical protein
MADPSWMTLPLDIARGAIVGKCPLAKESIGERYGRQRPPMHLERLDFLAPRLKITSYQKCGGALPNHLDGKVPSIVQLG